MRISDWSSDVCSSGSFIINPQEILYNLEMDDASFNDQGYDIRAVSICKLGPDDFITTPSPVISGLKDTYSPRLFGSAQPANVVLGVSDEIRLNFNETIARSEEHTSELQSLMRISYAVFCLKKKKLRSTTQATQHKH